MAAEDPEVLSKPPFLADIQLSPVRASGIWGGKRSNHLSLSLRSRLRRSHRLASVASLNLIPLPPRRRNVPSRTYVQHISPLLLSTLPVLSYRGGTD